jgi:hypothetical protein
MTRFLIQTNDNNWPTEGFGYTAVEAVKYNNWLRGDSVYDYALLSRKSLIVGDFTVQPNDVPVGSVEFALDVFARQGVSDIRPLNVPQELFRFCKRRVGYFTTLVHLNGQWMVKDASVIKNNDNGIMLLPNDSEGDFFASEYVSDIAAEWRVFVHKGEPVTMKCYAGDEWVLPEKRYIRDVVNAYSPIRDTFTLDLIVKKSGNTDILEIHDFFSCGLYGFEDLSVLPLMWAKAARIVREKYKSVE